ncbi:MAG TPA: hypothetical protein VEN81_17740 [Planctomycetota bacterium]|nr:hypothetical protein [Planctomycetota bacterium]
MGDRSTAFVKGGCGCLLAFLGLGAIALVAGGRVHIDCGGAGILFLIGGVIGLIVLAVYNKGVRAGRDTSSDEPPEYHPEPPPPGAVIWWCRECGSTNPLQAKICQRCHADR